MRPADVRDTWSRPAPKVPDNVKKSRAPKVCGLRGPSKSAITYFPAEQYHRPQGLDF